MIIDGFLQDFDHVVDSIKGYSPYQNFDGAVYPAISLDVNTSIVSALVNRIELAQGFKIKPNYIFFRANEDGASEPYQAHTDLNMGQYTCIVYIKGVGGTAFLKHKQTGMESNDPALIDVWQRDCNNYDAWEVVDYCELKPNRALLYNAELMHRGEPVDGHGVGKDARQLLICFYDKADNEH